ncbi:uncharacterized protein LOC133323859 [Musca vetustissima]|uniref:uncharacterized protein LOC133323859 n=1 Tax=Musca vetustissima TaxID=27455 RepID=UPI002AB77581|nr:uncharacterized protein LOC133323859 [Musca vetustissima]
MSPDEDGPHEETGRIVYDQRQSGKYNIHVVIKDVAIIEMGQNEFQDTSYNDEDYYYDENDLTVKPITLNPPTTTSTIKPTVAASTNNGIIVTAPNIDGEIRNSSPITMEAHTYTTLNQQQESETTLSSNILWNTLTSMISRKPTVDDLVTTLKSPGYSTGETTVLPSIDVKPRSKIEPIFANEEFAKFRDDAMPLRNSKIYKLKIRRSHQPLSPSSKKLQARRCRSHQSRNANGNCSNKRSTSGSLL